MLPSTLERATVNEADWIVPSLSLVHKIILTFCHATLISKSKLLRHTHTQKQDKPLVSYNTWPAGEEYSVSLHPDSVCITYVCVSAFAFLREQMSV